jgi:hypothetical protein
MRWIHGGVRVAIMATGLAIVGPGSSVLAQGTPHFRVNPANEHVWGHQWPTGVTVTVMVGNPGVPIGSSQVGTAGDWHLDGDGHDHDLQFGELVTVSDGTTTISHTVRVLTVTQIDPDTDIVSGTAAPGSWVSVGVHITDNVGRNVQANPSGEWSADFSVAIPGDGNWGRAYDIVEDLTGGANQEDDQSQPFGSTFIEWRVMSQDPAILADWLIIQNSAEEGGQMEYWFEFGVGGRGILAARLQTPPGVWHALSPGWWREELGFDANEPTVVDLDIRFPAGEYLLEITRASGVSTSIVNIAQSLAWPNQMPTIVNPQDGALNVPFPGASLQWNAAASPNFSLIAVEVDGLDCMFESEDRFADNTLDDYLMTGLEPNRHYEVSLGFGNRLQGTTADGIAFDVYRAQFLESRFTTLPPAIAWDNGFTDIGSGWRRLAGFGDYVPMGGAGWIWHNKHGFLYVPASSTSQNLWMFTQDMGWLYTGNTLYPFLFRAHDAAWLWYNGSSNPRWFVNMGTGQWESRP